MCLGKVIRSLPIVTAILTQLVLSGYGLRHQWLGLSQPCFPHLGAGDVAHGPVCQWGGLLPRKCWTVSDLKPLFCLASAYRSVHLCGTQGPREALGCSNCLVGALA